MSTDSHPNSSFSAGRKWSIGFNVIVLMAAVLAVVVMLNYLSRDYFLRLPLSTRNRVELSSRTINLLHSITNRVKVILYYDKQEPLYSIVRGLLDEYARLNPRISIQAVDYLRDPAGAQKIKTDYKLSSAADKNLVLFDCDGWVVRLDGDALTHYIVEKLPTKDQAYRKKPTEFEGETHFSAALLAVTNPKTNNAYFLQGHHEHPLESGGDYGYAKFAAILNQNHVRSHPLSLTGSNGVPSDCSLLVLAGPSDKLFDEELQKIENYLEQGGRMLVLLNSYSINRESGAETTGLDKLLGNWGVQIGTQLIRDPDRFIYSKNDLTAAEFNQNHPLVNPLVGDRTLYLIRPRAVSKLKGLPASADAPHVEELVFSGPRAFAGENSPPQKFSFVVAVEKGGIRGVTNDRGATRIVVCGDSFFLSNAGIVSVANSDFADLAINWLLDRTQLLKGVGPRPVTEYRILMTHAQLQRAEWLLLGGLPGGVLVLGGVVWLRRRK